MLNIIYLFFSSFLYLYCRIFCIYLSWLVTKEILRYFREKFAMKDSVRNDVNKSNNMQRITLPRVHRANLVTLNFPRDFMSTMLSCIKLPADFFCPIHSSVEISFSKIRHIYIYYCVLFS